jgi:hypothetical protein
MTDGADLLKEFKHYKENLKKFLNRKGYVVNENVSLSNQENLIVPELSVTHSTREKWGINYFVEFVQFETFWIKDAVELKKSDNTIEMFAAFPQEIFLKMKRQLVKKVFENEIRFIIIRKTDIEIADKIDNGQDIDLQVDVFRKKIRKLKVTELINEYKKYKPGKLHWAKYERICEKILTTLFVPPLDEPSRQVRSYNGIHRVDSTFPSHAKKSWWGEIYEVRDAKLIVVDYKNFSDTVPKDEVLKVYGGLSSAKKFAIIVTRKGLKRGGVTQANECYRADKTIIICVNENDVFEMLDKYQNLQDPADVLKRVLDKFLCQTTR